MKRRNLMIISGVVVLAVLACLLCEDRPSGRCSKVTTAAGR